MAESNNASLRFTQVLDQQISPVVSAQFADPILITDLDHDNSDEIILAGANTKLIWDPESSSFKSEKLLSFDTLMEAAVILDVEMDGNPDLVVSTSGSILVFHGDGDRGFAIPPTISEIPELEGGTAIAAADVNQDGLTDLWLGQYLWPYEHNKSPSPYDDANDGLPAFLLINQGGGKFKDFTVGSGLDEKRYRRVYTGEFLDFDQDGYVDFIQVNDFDGLDYYKGIKGGKFKRMTEDLLGETRGFGMSHLIGDFDGDTRPDLAMFGMVPKQAVRMDQMGVAHPGFPSVVESRKAMIYGNRIWMNQGEDQWTQEDWGEDYRDTGWTWGSTFSDFDNDGRGDFYIGNGYMSNHSSEDLDGDFWRFVVYTVGNTTEAMEQYMSARSQRFAMDSMSLGGHHFNAFLQLTPLGWKDFAWLDGIALSDDSLNSVSLDFNHDGALDLAIVTQSIIPELNFRLKVFKNQGNANHWIGVRFDVEAGKNIWGSRVELKMKNGTTQTSWVLSSQGFRTQPGAFAHFGLGSDSEVASVTVTWPDSSTTEIASPKADQWIRVKREGQE